MGETVDLAAIEEPAKDFADNVTASDLALCIKQLRSQLAEVERRRVGLEAERRASVHAYCEAEGEEWSIRYVQLCYEITEVYAKIRAAHSVSQSNGNTFCVIAPESLSSLSLTNPLPYEVQRATGLQKREFNGRAIEESNAVRLATSSLISQMEGV